jgi:hypothetical protein
MPGWVREGVNPSPTLDHSTLESWTPLTARDLGGFEKSIFNLNLTRIKNRHMSWMANVPAGGLARSRPFQATSFDY